MEVETTAAQEELKRFFLVAKDRQQIGLATNMPACAVDTYWHNLLRTSAYLRFCKAIVGAHVGHAPSQGHGELPWVRAYELKFGKLNPLWFTNESGHLDAPSFEAYLRTGKVVTSWDCSPIVPPN